MRRLLLLVLLGVAGLVLDPVVPTAHAQVALGDTLVFERVGDQPIDAYDFAFDPEGSLWAISTDVWRLSPGETAWDEVGFVGATYIFPLSPDTLLAGAHAIDRSLDGGQTWEEVDEEGRALNAAPLSGSVVVGTGVGSGVAYSHDRGATWQPGSIDDGTWVATAEAFVELPKGHPHAGRLVAACRAGLSYSDDDGVTWRVSNLWDGARYLARSVTVGADGRVFATIGEVGVAGTQIAASDDGGQTYEIVYGFGVAVGSQVRIVAVPGGPNPEVGVLVVVEYDGSVWRSDDGAESFRPVGQIPFAYEYPSSHHNDTVLGPDGRLYVAAGKSGPDREWVYRTVGPVVATVQEPGPEPGESGLRLEVAPNPFRGSTVVTVTLERPGAVRVAVYDRLGREVAVLTDGRFEAGQHEATLDGAGLAAGLYLVRATVTTPEAEYRYLTRVTVLR